MDLGFGSNYGGRYKSTLLHTFITEYLQNNKYFLEHRGINVDKLWETVDEMDLDFQPNFDFYTRTGMYKEADEMFLKYVDRLWDVVSKHTDKTIVSDIFAHVNRKLVTHFKEEMQKELRKHPDREYKLPSWFTDLVAKIKKHIINISVTTTLKRKYNIKKRKFELNKIYNFNKLSKKNRVMGFKNLNPHKRPK